ncbi:unnamed protein product [Notodromas monacha]|uniref:DUF4789 domain-containing protein n=1 Tax=Notodromas monacha TaxID=399045 RepID=A0A7R9GDF5_9CRUS|nr:unnamed protein product [Notodromas monacha]CAG0918489.1 unnamed protein product [Notodromas monacha]
MKSTASICLTSALIQIVLVVIVPVNGASTIRFPGDSQNQPDKMIRGPDDEIDSGIDAFKANPLINGIVSKRAGRVIFADDADDDEQIRSTEEEMRLRNGPKRSDHLKSIFDRVDVSNQLHPPPHPIDTIIGPCNWNNLEVLYNGKCQRLLRLGVAACNRDPRQWLVIDPRTWTPVCQTKPCDNAGDFLWEDGNCYPATQPGEEIGNPLLEPWVQSDLCGSNEGIYYNVHGIGSCDCAPGAAYSPQSRACHVVYSRGHCELGQVFMPVHDAVQCLPNPCNLEGELLWADGLCYMKFSHGPCPSGQVVSVNQKTLLPTCTTLEPDVDMKALIVVPTKRHTFRGLDCSWVGSKWHFSSGMCPTTSSSTSRNHHRNDLDLEDDEDTISVVGEFRTVGNPFNSFGQHKNNIDACSFGFIRNPKTKKMTDGPKYPLLCRPCHFLPALHQHQDISPLFHRTQPYGFSLGNMVSFRQRPNAGKEVNEHSLLLLDFG